MPSNRDETRLKSWRVERLIFFFFFLRIEPEPEIKKALVSYYCIPLAHIPPLTNYFKTCKMRTSRLENNKALQKKKEKKERSYSNEFLLDMMWLFW